MEIGTMIRQLLKCSKGMTMDTPQALLALSALAQESRLAVFRLLIQCGPEGLAATKIAEHLDIAPSSLSFHLKELSHSGLVTSRQHGRFVIYSADTKAMSDLVGFLTENCCAGIPCDTSSLAVSTQC
jgi:ArsR family transcriptional regulator